MASALKSPGTSSTTRMRWRNRTGWRMANFAGRTLGMVDGVLLLPAAHTVREEGEAETIRIISARRAEPQDRKRYEKERRTKCQPLTAAQRR